MGESNDTLKLNDIDLCKDGAMPHDEIWIWDRRKLKPIELYPYKPGQYMKTEFPTKKEWEDQSIQNMPIKRSIQHNDFIEDDFILHRIKVSEPIQPGDAKNSQDFQNRRTESRKKYQK